MIKISLSLRQFFIGFFFLLVGSTCFNQLVANEYNIIPYPKTLIPKTGIFTFDNKTVIICPNKPEVLKLAQQFATQFALVTGIKLNVQHSQRSGATNAVIFELVNSLDGNPEAYDLQISPKYIKLSAQAGNGFFYGLQSLYQLLPTDIYCQQRSALKSWTVPCVQINDTPRFVYRGLHLDVSRHFFPVPFIKKYIDAMAIHKLNTFHWHLTDDQGWRIEIKKYPRLTEIGSKRDETLKGYYFDNYPQQFDGKPYGGFYTQDEVREIVAYAKSRFITVIPEIELPGHAQAAVAAYPHLSCTQDSAVKVATKWGVFTEVYCSREKTFEFMEDVLTEVMAIFPSKYIHIGGDECPKDNWKKCPDCQALIKRLNLKNEDGLQSYFVERIEKFCNSRGRQIIGWDEILDGGLAPNATVMSWRGTQGGIAAAKSGHDVIMTPLKYCYLDHYQTDALNEPTTIGGFLPLKTVYEYEPVPAELTAIEEKHVLGAQANIWSEYMPTSESVEYMAYPRVSAMSEVVWGSKENRDWDNFRSRMSTDFERYNRLNIKPCRAFFDVQFQSTITSNKKLQITLECDHPDVQIHYNTTGKTPAITDLLYDKPFILDASAKITAAAFVNGKMFGKTTSSSFVVSKLTGLAYTKNVASTSYDGGNVNSLTDGKEGNAKVTTQWLGLGKGVDCEIIFECGDALNPITIEKLSVGMLQATALGVSISPEIQLYGSLDGKQYKFIADSKIPQSKVSFWEVIRPQLVFAPVQIRFLKVVLKKGADSPLDIQKGGTGGYLFIDEIGAW
jgi:hexosaminidase